MLSRRPAVLAAAAVLASACASHPATAPEPVAAGPVALAASRGRTWDAVTALLATTWQMPTKTISPESGLVQTDVVWIDDGSAAHCPFMAKGGRLFATITFLVRGDSTRSTLEVTPAYTKVASGVSFSCTTAHTIETRFAADVKQRLGAP